MIVSNSSPLIFLAKLNVFDQVKRMYSQILIPREVYEEVILKGENCKEVLKKLLDEKYLVVVAVETEKEELKSLHAGERKAIELCLQKKIKTILLDDKEAVEYARLLGIEALRTTRLLLEMVKRRLMSHEQFDEALVRLSKEGYFLTLDVYHYLIEAARKK